MMFARNIISLWLIIASLFFVLGPFVPLVAADDFDPLYPTELSVRLLVVSDGATVTLIPQVLLREALARRIITSAEFWVDVTGVDLSSVAAVTQPDDCWLLERAGTYQGHVWTNGYGTPSLGCATPDDWYSLWAVTLTQTGPVVVAWVDSLVVIEGNAWYWVDYPRELRIELVPVADPPDKLSCQYARGDMNGDYVADLFDIDLFVDAAYQTEGQFCANHPAYCDRYCAGDCNCDGQNNLFDVDAFVKIVSGDPDWPQGPCPEE